MNTEPDSKTPPYATYKSFSNFINSLRENSIPSRIDRSVFGSMSGGAAYSILASLKGLHLIEDSGKPTPLLKSYVEADEKSQKTLLQQILKKGYSSLWDDGIDLATASAGQFDDHVRDRFGAKGSTVDKVASFFLAAAEDAGIQLSTHLKNRKSTGPSTGSKRSSKSARRQDSAENSGNGGGFVSTQTEEKKPLEYQLIDLLKSPNVAQEVQDAIWKIVKHLSTTK